AYSWSGGLVWVRGDVAQPTLAMVTADARRGDTRLRVSDAHPLRAGQRVVITETDNARQTLATALYSGDPGDITRLGNSASASLVCRIVRIAGNEIQFDRPLRFDVKKEWSPRITGFEPRVVECGVENL